MRFPCALCLVSLAAPALGQEPVRQTKPKHLLRYAFRKGDSGKFQMLQQIMQSMGKKPPTVGVIHVVDCSWRVTEVHPKHATVELRFDRIRSRSTKNEPGEYDADSKKGHTLDFNGEGAGTVLQMKVDSRGRVEVIDEDPKSRRKHAEQMRLMVRELPALPVGVGDTWKVKGPKPPAGTKAAEVEIHNRLVRVDKKKIELGYTTQMDIADDFLKIDAGNSRGTMIFDLGRFIPDRVEQNLAIDISHKNKKSVWMRLRLVFRLGPVGTLDTAKKKAKANARK